MNILVLGMGNPLLTDDAAGIRIAQILEKEFEKEKKFDFISDCSLGGLNLLDLIQGYDRLIVIDSIKTKGGIPGTYSHFTADRLRETMNLNCVHDANFATVLELGRRMGMNLPADESIDIFAVEIIENQTFSSRMSDILEESLNRLSQEIGREIRAILSS